MPQRLSAREGATYPNPELIKCPYPYYERELADGAVTKIAGTDGPDEYLVFTHDDVRFVFSHEDEFSAQLPENTIGKHFAGGVSIGWDDDPRHKRNRELMSRPFAPGRLRDLEPRVREIVDSLIDGFVVRGSVELVDEFANAVPIAVICVMMGLGADEETLAFVRRWSKVMTEATHLAAGSHGVDPVIAEMQELMAREIGERVGSPPADILGEIAHRQIERDGTFDLGLNVTLAQEIVVGGVITTGMMIVNTLLLLLAAPDELERVRTDRSLIIRALEETLRLRTPVQWRRRYVRNEVELGGQAIPAGSLVTLVTGAANIDPRRFASPRTFSLERKNTKRHFGFGLGRHFCVGAPLARLEGRIALDRLLTRLSDIRLSGPAAEIEYLNSMRFHAPAALHLTFARAPDDRRTGMSATTRRPGAGQPAAD